MPREPFHPQATMRFVKQDLLAKTQNYLAQQQAGEPTTYRESVREQYVPPSYANNDNGRRFSHVTLWRWLSWLTTLRRKWQTFQKDGFEALARKARSDRG